MFHRDGAPILSYTSAWKRACKRAGLIGKIPHDFRRTAARRLMRAGVPITVSMKLIGHKTESMFRRYSIVTEADTRAGVEQVAALEAADAEARRRHEGTR